MSKFPKMVGSREPKKQRMSLREYAPFCERCLYSNPHITSENCLTKRADEAANRKPFSLVEERPRKSKRR